MQILDDEIKCRAEPIEGISSLLIFGSRAHGTERPDSDLDVAEAAAGTGETEWSIATRSRVA